MILVVLVWVVASAAAACWCPTDLQQANCESARLIYQCQLSCLLAGNTSDKCADALGCCFYVKELVPLYAELDVRCGDGFECGDGSMATWIFILISCAAGVALLLVAFFVWRCFFHTPPPAPPPA
jgi:hypothetical protein